MGLPIQKAPTYNCELPLTGLKVKFRPFLVKEQNHLLIIKESQGEEEIFGAITDMIKAVTNDEIDASKLPMADLEYLFINIRARSVGESIEVPYICRHEGCGHVYKSTLDLLSLDVNDVDIEEQIQISDNLIVEMRPPIAKDAIKWTGLDEHELIKPLMRTCMIRLYDEEEIYDMNDHRDSEIDEFIESLSLEQFDKISNFFASLPTLQHNEKWTCEKCKNENNVVLKGLQNFF